MKKKIDTGTVVIVEPDYWLADEEDIKQRAAIAQVVADEIKRHVDSVAAVYVEKRSEYVCSFCGDKWGTAIADDGCPWCCDKAVAEADSLAKAREAQG